jgi:hypothetical protein
VCFNPFNKAIFLLSLIRQLLNAFSKAGISACQARHPPTGTRSKKGKITRLLNNKHTQKKATPGQPMV